MLSDALYDVRLESLQIYTLGLCGRDLTTLWFLWYGATFLYDRHQKKVHKILTEFLDKTPLRCYSPRIDFMSGINTK